MDKPRFCHTCESCTFIGCHGLHDLYLCRRDTVPKFIARFDHDETDFEWEIAQDSGDPMFHWAYERAMEMDLFINEGRVDEQMDEMIGAGDRFDSDDF